VHRSSTCLRSPAALALTVLLCAVASAQSSTAVDVPARWTRIGPDGGVVAALAVAPSQPATVYAGLRNDGGVYRSIDGGLSWRFAGAGLGRTESVTALAVDAAQPGTVYAVAGIVLYRSVNGGASWASVKPIASPVSVVTVAADPQRSGTVYAALAGRGIATSVNRGGTWKELGGPADTTKIVIDPVSPETLYAGTLSSGLFKSTDGGLHWKAIARDIHPVLTTVAALAIDPQHPRTLVVARQGDAPYRSVDGGGRWTKTHSAGFPAEPDVRALAFDTATSAMLAGTAENGVFRSGGGGLAWQPASAGLPDSFINALLGAPGGLIAGSQTGVAASHDHGQTWTVGRGVRGTIVSSLAIDSQSPPRMYAFGDGRLFKSANRGGSWTRLTLTPPPVSGSPTALGPVAVHPGNPLQIELGYEGAIARSDDGGGSWGDGTEIDCFRPQRIVVDPNDSEVLYVNGSFPTTECLVQPGSCDSFKLDHGQVSCLRVTENNPQGWRVVAVDPRSSSHLLSGEGTPYESLDAGATWSALPAAPNSSFLMFDPAQSGTLYAAPYSNGVARSSDNGATWTTGTAGLPPHVLVISLAIDPVHPSTLYATTGKAVYRSTSSGATWEKLGTGLEDVLVVEIKLDPIDPRILYAATLGGGVMRLKM
jgi:photosystem II stability/assembly factor-like uncharacterized protein